MNLPFWASIVHSSHRENEVKFEFRRELTSGIGQHDGSLRSPEKASTDAQNRTGSDNEASGVRVNVKCTDGNL